MDDLSMLETVLLTNIGLAAYNFKHHVSSNLPCHNQMIPRDNLKSQQYLDSIQKWTEDKKMVLNEKKTKNIIFNFSKSNQFVTDLKLKNEELEVVNETKLLGVFITSDLKWNKNTDYLIKDANRRMKLLHKAAKFSNNLQDLLIIYKTFIRSKLEQSASVWHSSLSECNISDLERVQKSALKVILKDKYKDYKNALLTLNIESLYDRRESLCLKFAKKGLKLELFKKLFPVQKTLHVMEKRSSEKFTVNSARTKRYFKSSIPSMQRMLNNYEKDLKRALRVSSVPNELYPCDSLVVKF